ncbi:MAG: hypothetical protein GXO15_03955, partial [Crenarchaeota archaeon]|nr:hypothetical protein [Thermoproteota archaeon]
ARRVGGDAPDTGFVTVAAEVVAAAAALRPGVRVVAPSEPEPGWGPLQRLLEMLEAEGLARVYRMPMRPGGRLRAWDVARRAGRMARGLSARLVDVTDAPPPVVAGLYGGGVRLLTVLVDMGYTAVFQRFGYM